MNVQTIIHFSQDFAKNKAQLGGFSRIYNICQDLNNHIIFTVSKENVAEEIFFMDRIMIISIPLNGRSLNRKNQILFYKKISNCIARFLKENNIIPSIFFGHSQLFNFFVLYHLRNKYYRDVKILWEANVIWGIHKSLKWDIKQNTSNRLNVFLERKVFKKADGIICQTELAKDYIKKHYCVEQAKMWVITNAVNIENLTSVDQVIESNKKFQRPFQVLCLGLFDEMNGIPFLVEYLDSNSNPSFNFSFLGTGLYQPLVKASADKGRCSYLGNVPYSKVGEVLSKFDFVIIPRLPRLEADLFIPTKIVEAMFYGLIPICSDVKAITSIIEDEINGFLFQSGNFSSLKSVIEKISQTPTSILNTISNKARNTIKDSFNWQTNHFQLNEIYKTLS